MDPVTLYAKAVTSGKEIAGPLVREAGARHLRDLKDGPKRGLIWDFPAAARVFEYFSEVLVLPNGKPFELHPAHQFIVGSLFGWKSRDGTRRFRQAYIEMGKGNAKSPMAAGVGMYMLTGDGQPGAVVFAAAVDKDQAKIPFQFAVGFVDRSELLSGAVQKSGGKMGDQTKVHNLFHRKSGSYFRPLTSESKGRGKSGYSIHCAILDEVHEHSTSAMVEFCRANMKGAQPLMLMITNSGEFSGTSVAWNYHEYSRDLLEGKIAADHFFGYVCGLDKGDSFQDRKVWKKANPLLNVSVSERLLEEQVTDAKGMPAKESLVRRLHFCEWVESIDPWITKELWDSNAGAVDREALRGRRCFGGWDLSKIRDLTTLVLVFPDDEAETLDVLTFAWAPEEGIAQREHEDQAPYRQWRDAGLLTLTPGPTIDYDFVAQTVGELTSEFDIQSIAFDHWHFKEMERALNLAGVDLTVIDHPQGFIGMNPAIEAAEQALLNKRIRHGGNKLLTWCVFNVKVEKNVAGLRAFVKQKATRRIDAAVSLAMACNLAGSFEDQEHGSYAVSVI